MLLFFAESVVFFLLFFFYTYPPKMLQLLNKVYPLYLMTSLHLLYAFYEKEWPMHLLEPFKEASNNISEQYTSAEQRVNNKFVPKRELLSQV